MPTTRPEGAILLIVLAATSASPIAATCEDASATSCSQAARPTPNTAAATWRARLRQQLAPVGRATAALRRAVAERPSIEVWPRCRALGKAIDAVDLGALQPVPDLVVGLHLRRALALQRDAVASCALGRHFGTEHRIARAEVSWEQLEEALERLVAGGASRPAGHRWTMVQGEDGEVRLETEPSKPPHRRPRP